MTTYHGTTDLILTSQTIVNLDSGAYRCDAEYTCRNTEIAKWLRLLVRGERMIDTTGSSDGGLNLFIIGDTVDIKIGNNGFTTFRVTGYANEVSFGEIKRALT